MIEEVPENFTTVRANTCTEKNMTDDSGQNLCFFTAQRLSDLWVLSLAETITYKQDFLVLTMYECMELAD